MRLEYLSESISDFVEKLEDENFILSLLYLWDVFSHFNDLNLSMQGIIASNTDCTENLEASKKKVISVEVSNPSKECGKFSYPG